MDLGSKPPVTKASAESEKGCWAAFCNSCGGPGTNEDGKTMLLSVLPSGIKRNVHGMSLHFCKGTDCGLDVMSNLEAAAKLCEFEEGVNSVDVSDFKNSFEPRVMTEADQTALKAFQEGLRLVLKEVPEAAKWLYSEESRVKERLVILATCTQWKLAHQPKRMARKTFEDICKVVDRAGCFTASIDPQVFAIAKCYVVRLLNEHCETWVREILEARGCGDTKRASDYTIYLEEFQGLSDGCDISEIVGRYCPNPTSTEATQANEVDGKGHTADVSQWPCYSGDSSLRELVAAFNAWPERPSKYIGFVLKRISATAAIAAVLGHLKWYRANDISYGPFLSCSHRPCFRGAATRLRMVALAHLESHKDKYNTEMYRGPRPELWAIFKQQLTEDSGAWGKGHFMILNDATGLPLRMYSFDDTTSSFREAFCLPGSGDLADAEPIEFVCNKRGVFMPLI